MEKRKNVIHRFLHSLAYMAAMMIFLGVLLAMVNAILRKLGFSLSWAQEISQYMVIIGFFLGIPYVISRDRMIKIGLFKAIVKNETVQKAVSIFFGCLEIFLFFLLARYCLKSINTLRIAGMELNYVRLQIYWLYVFVEVSCILALASLVNVLILNRGNKFND